MFWANRWDASNSFQVTGQSNSFLDSQNALHLQQDTTVLEPPIRKKHKLQFTYSKERGRV